jgi:hypothetical protein
LGIGLLFFSCQHSGESDQSQGEDNRSTERAPFSAAYVENSDSVSNLDSENEATNLQQPEPRIETSRINAITRAVEKGSEAVVSIMATEPIRRQETPRDEFFRFFFGDQFPRENTIWDPALL